jgi:hypothetical protein
MKKKCQRSDERLRPAQIAARREACPVAYRNIPLYLLFNPSFSILWLAKKFSDTGFVG